MATVTVTELGKQTDAAWANHYHWNDHAKIRKAAGLPDAP